LARTHSHNEKRQQLCHKFFFLGKGQMLKYAGKLSIVVVDLFVVVVVVVVVVVIVVVKCNRTMSVWKRMPNAS